MEKLNIYAILIVFYMFTAMQIDGRKIGDEGDEVEVAYMCLKNEKVAKIHYFAQDIIGGPNGTVHEIARAAVSTAEPLSFGRIFVIDDLVTVGPGSDSGILGKSQGIMTSADMVTTATAMSYNVVFTAGEYNGSTLSIAGRNPVAARQRQLSVVGGTGVFRFTRGYAVVNIYSSVVGRDSVVHTVLEYTIYTTYCP